MRDKISDQDLTNYALNDGLEPRERLYVESMLGVSEPCREDVYRLLEVSQLLEEGFARRDEEAALLPGLTAAQRARLLDPPPVQTARDFLRQAASALSLAACIAFVLANARSLQMERHSLRVAEVSRMVSDALTSDDGDIALWVNPPTVSPGDGADAGALMQTSEMGYVANDDPICTPPMPVQVEDGSEM